MAKLSRRDAIDTYVEYMGRRIAMAGRIWVEWTGFHPTSWGRLFWQMLGWVVAMLVLRYTHAAGLVDQLEWSYAVLAGASVVTALQFLAAYMAAPSRMDHEAERKFRGKQVQWWDEREGLVQELDSAQRQLAKKKASPYPYPYAKVTSIPMVRESERFAHREWTVHVQNLGKVTGKFTAEMRPTFGVGNWRVPWRETGTGTCELDGGAHGNLLVFGDYIDVLGTATKAPVEYDALEDDVSLRTEWHGYGRPDEFVLTITSNHADAPASRTWFHFVRGGIEPGRKRQSGR